MIPGIPAMPKPRNRRLIRVLGVAAAVVHVTCVDGLVREVDGGLMWGPGVGDWSPRTEQKSSAQEASLLQQDPPSPHLYIFLYKKTETWCGWRGHNWWRRKVEDTA